MVRYKKTFGRVAWGIVLTLLTIGCKKQQSQDIEIFCTNMLYACDCSSYRIDSVTDASFKVLKGREISLNFENKNDEVVFLDSVGVNAICYLYNLTGYFQKEDAFVVRKYILIPKSEECFK